MYANWQKAKTWQVEQRYTKVGQKTNQEAQGIIEASRIVLNWLIKV